MMSGAAKGSRQGKGCGRWQGAASAERSLGAGFTLVEVLLSLALSALLFTAALNLLLGVMTAWDRARAGDLRADGDYRLFAFLRDGLAAENAGEEDAVRVETLPGERSEHYLTFPLRGSPLAGGAVREWRTERFALLADRDGLGLLPFVDEEDDRPSPGDAIPLFGGEVEVAYWFWDEARERWEEEDDLEPDPGSEAGVPAYLVLRFPDERVRWIRIGPGEGDAALW